MPSRARFLPLIGLLVLLLAASPAFCAEPAIFDMAAFNEAQADGRSVILETYAPWCPACRRQAPLLDWLSDAPAFRHVIVMRVGEAAPKKVWRQFRLDAFGTLVLYRDGREVARDTPQTTAGIAHLLQLAATRQ